MVNGQPVEGATITVKGTRNSVKTDENGNFSIMASPEERLIVTNVGFAAREFKVGNSATVNIQLTQDFGHLDDVVVIGYGKMKKSDMSAAVESISAEDLNKTVNTTLDEALLGKAANVYVSQTSGQPGAGASIIIRGVSTVTGNYQPLYVIDGVQIRPSAPPGGSYTQPSGYAERAGWSTPTTSKISVYWKGSCRHVDLWRRGRERRIDDHYQTWQGGCDPCQFQQPVQPAGTSQGTTGNEPGAICPVYRKAPALWSGRFRARRIGRSFHPWPRYGLAGRAFP